VCGYRSSTGSLANPAHDGVGVARLGQVGLLVGDALAARCLEQRPLQVGGGDVVAGRVEVVDQCGADLAAGAGDEDAHAPDLYPIAAPAGVVRHDSQLCGARS
jgi:hypothetical protein